MLEHWGGAMRSDAERCGAWGGAWWWQGLAGAWQVVNFLEPRMSQGELVLMRLLEIAFGQCWASNSADHALKRSSFFPLASNEPCHVNSEYAHGNTTI